jgi:hypothetical protein
MPSNLNPPGHRPEAHRRRPRGVKINPQAAKCLHCARIDRELAQRTGQDAVAPKNGERWAMMCQSR